MAHAGLHRYYRGVVLPACAAEWGWAVLSELHYWFKVAHIHPSRWVWVDGEFQPPSSADLSDEEFRDFLQGVLNHAFEWGVAVPPER